MEKLQRKQGEMRIKDCEIGIDQPPSIVAEMSGNHKHSMERSLEIVEAASGAGAQMLKLQTYTPALVMIAAIPTCLLVMARRFQTRPLCTY